MNYIRSITGIVALLALSVVAGAQTIPDNVGKSSSGLPAQLQNVGFAPQLNAQLPLDLSFRDESGRDVQLREYFGRKEESSSGVTLRPSRDCLRLAFSHRKRGGGSRVGLRRQFPLFLRRTAQPLRPRQRHHATHSRWPHLALFLRCRVPFPRCASRLGRRFRWKNRNAHRPSAALLLSI